MAQVTVDAVKAMQSVTLVVRLARTKELWWRIRIGCVLLRLAARVMGCNLQWESSANEREPEPTAL